ncbi:RNA-binding domain-containing protein [Nitrosopumilus sp.]|uniref:RNA-binding domain-containing protein n=1 Tax=Nitrosopumilus sp. TaxID=2024843 RepID=UPI00261BB44F|nr:RNA-binding domain-containing protein [Nitrosopumilus sp.]
MIEKIEITIDVIVHATEDIKKIFQAFEEMLELNEDDFSIQKTTGHFDNPIIILNSKIVKKQAQNLIEKILDRLSKEQIDQMVEEIEERTMDSRFHMRLGKQEMVKGNLVFVEKDPIKMKIHTPVYNKKETVKIFTEIFQKAN